MKILIIPNRASPFDYNLINGGLEAIQYNIVKNLRDVHELDYLAFGNEDFGPLVPNKIHNIGLDLTKYSMTHVSRVRKYILEHQDEMNEYDVIIGIEISKSTINAFHKIGMADKIVNILATPFNPNSHVISQLYGTCIYLHSLGGSNHVPTKTFKNYINNVYPNLDESERRISNDKIDYDYWQRNDICSDLLYPPILLEKPEVKESDGTAISTQRYDVLYRKSNIALNSLELFEGPKVAYMPSKWNAPAKYHKSGFTVIDSPRDEILEKLRTSLVMVNTCFNSGTVENSSLEAISNGVPVLQLLEEGNLHATLEYDPFTTVVEYPKGSSTKEILEMYSEALNSFTDTIDNRINRANALYLMYNKESYLNQWDKLLKSK